VIEQLSCIKCGEPMLWRDCKRCEGNLNRDRTERLAELIRDLRASPPRSPESERQCIKRLLALGHPSPDECVRAAVEKAGATTRVTRDRV
jgi:hypothetical protein